MPFACQIPDPLAFWVAEHATSHTLLGGWCLHWKNPAKRTAGFFWRLEDALITTPMGSTLLQKLQTIAKEHQVQQLIRARLVAEGSADALLLRRQGFVPIDATLWFVADAEPLFQRLDAVWQRLLRSSTAPSIWQIQEPTPAIFPAISTLIQRHHLVTPDELSLRLQAGPYGYKKELCRVVLQKDLLVGVLLSSCPDPETAEVDVRVVDKTLAGPTGVANAWLMREALAHAVNLKIRQVRFRAHPGDHRETENLARRSGAKALPRQFLFAKKLV
jgi:hypothetical protein